MRTCGGIFRGIIGEIACGNSRAQSKNGVEFPGLSKKSCGIFLGLGFLRGVTLFCRVFILEVKFGFSAISRKG